MRNPDIRLKQRRRPAQTRHSEAEHVLKNVLKTGTCGCGVCGRNQQCPRLPRLRTPGVVHLVSEFASGDTSCSVPLYLAVWRNQKCPRLPRLRTPGVVHLVSEFAPPNKRIEQTAKAARLSCKASCSCSYATRSTRELPSSGDGIMEESLVRIREAYQAVFRSTAPSRCHGRHSLTGAV